MAGTTASTRNNMLSLSRETPPARFAVTHHSALARAKAIPGLYWQVTPVAQEACPGVTSRLILPGTLGVLY